MRWMYCCPETPSVWVSRSGGGGLPTKRLKSYISNPVMTCRIPWRRELGDFLCSLPPRIQGNGRRNSRGNRCRHDCRPLPFLTTMDPYLIWINFVHPCMEFTFLLRLFYEDFFLLLILPTRSTGDTKSTWTVSSWKTHPPTCIGHVTSTAVQSWLVTTKMKAL